jgi:hypothetical protein
MIRLATPKEIKHLRGLSYLHAIPLSYNSFYVEDVLTGLFYVTRVGRRRGKGSWGGRQARDVAQELSLKKERFHGFDSEQGMVLLAEWLKASILRLIERGTSDKVMSIRPLHFMTYRVDLPASWAGMRSIPEFVAAILHHDPQNVKRNSNREEPFSLESPNNLFWKSFGLGLDNDDERFAKAEQDKYDEITELDIETLLAIRVAEHFDPPKAITGKKKGKGGEISGFEPLCPNQANVFRDDFSLFLRAYPQPIVPVRVLGDYMICLLALNLTTYSLSHFAASNHLYTTGEWLSDRPPQDSNRVWKLGIYPDLTGGRNRKSRELARRSFASHDELMQKQLLKDLNKQKGVERLRTLALGRRASHVEAFNAAEAYARHILNTIETYYEDNDWEWPEEFQSIISDSSLSTFDSLVELFACTLVDLQKNILKFFWCCGRRNLDSGLLAGSPRQREDNYYTLGFQVLETLVQLLVLRAGDPPRAKSLDIYDFVETLKRRYGIWIDEPPPDLDRSPEAYQAAEANFSALKEKLRQLGFFRAVTDARRKECINGLNTSQPGSLESIRKHPLDTLHD